MKKNQVPCGPFCNPLNSGKFIIGKIQGFNWMGAAEVRKTRAHASLRAQ